MIYKLHKIINIVFLVVCAVLLVCTCIFMTQYGWVSSSVTGFASQLQSANNWLLLTFAVAIVSFALFYVFGNSRRKKMYISNFVSGIVLPLIVIIIATITIVKISACISTFVENYDVLKAYNDRMNTNDFNQYEYDQKGFIFGITSCSLAIVVSLLYLAINTIKTIQSNRKVRDISEVVVDAGV